MDFCRGEGGADFVDRVACIILAGGQGTRLFPLTQQRCKPAVIFGGRYRLIDIPLSHALNAKISSVYVISQYLIGSLHEHILETYSPSLTRNSKIHLLSPEETSQSKTWYNGTADAIRKNLSYFAASSADYFLILSGDQLYNMDLHEMLLFARQEDADLVIGALPVEEAEAKRMGLLQVTSENRVLDFVEKPSDPKILEKFVVSKEILVAHPYKNQDKQHYLGSMGIYIFKREALFALLKESGDDFGKNLIPIQFKKGKTSAFVYQGYWEDIGTISSYYYANIALLSQKNCLDVYDEKNPIFSDSKNLPSPIIRETHVKESIISLGSIIEAEEITRSVVGVRAHIKKGSIIRDSIIMGNHYYEAPLHQSPPLPPHFSIGENCFIEKAIIDEHCCIGNRVQLINKDKLQHYDGNGIYIRDGIIIVPTGTTLPDHFIL